MEGRFWFVELSPLGVCVGDRVAHRRYRSLLDAKCDADHPQESCNRVGLVLVIVQIGDTYVPRTPLTDKATVTGVWVFYTLFVLIAFAMEKIGSRRKINAPW